jgi:Uncharacterized conserved protein
MHFPKEAIKAITEFIFISHSPQRGDILFVPGGSSLEPARKAAQLYHEGFAPFILPSGCFSKVDASTCGAFETEWAAMRHELLLLSVPEAAILKENRATYTYENAILSREVTDAHGLLIKTAILCCKPAHARRALIYYQSCFPDAKIRVCPCLDAITRENWHETEQGIQTVFKEITGIGAYQGELLLPVLI